MLPMEEIMKSVEQYVKEGKIGFFTEEDTTEKTEPITIPVTKICLKYYIDETAGGLVYRPVWSFCCPYQWKDSPEGQELFYIDGETGALIRDAFGWQIQKTNIQNSVTKFDSEYPETRIGLQNIFIVIE